MINTRAWSEGGKDIIHALVPLFLGYSTYKVDSHVQRVSIKSA